MAPALPLYRYQQEWLADRSRFKIGMFARQTGKTFTTTLEIVDSCLAAAAAGTRERWVILSRGERQAKEAMDEGVKRHASAFGAALADFDHEWVGEQTRVKALEVELPGGSRITALPANPDTARGFSANVFLDEFAFHQDSHAIWRALFPVISAGWRLRITSTPNGKSNKFYELISGRDDAWSRHVVDIYRAVADGLPRDIAALRAGIADDDAWAQEYELQFLDEATAWLPFELIGSVEDEAAGRPELYQGGRCFVGVDIGRRRDLFVIWVAELVGDVLWTREIVELKGATFADQDAARDEVFRRYRVDRSCWDQTGMGEKPVEDAQRAYGAMRVEGVLMTAPTQLRLATAAKEAYQDRRIRIPAGRRELRSDLHKIRKEVGPTGIPRFVAERDAQGHADRAWACFLAIGAADRPAGTLDHEALPKPDQIGAVRDFLGPGLGRGRTVGEYLG